jgi:Flp pilus assembly pilin Flp
MVRRRNSGLLLALRACTMMIPLLKQFVRDEAGEDLIEYGLLCSFVASVALVTILMDPIGVRTSVVDAYKRAVEALYMAAQGDVQKL